MTKNSYAKNLNSINFVNLLCSVISSASIAARGSPMLNVFDSMSGFIPVQSRSSASSASTGTNTFEKSVFGWVIYA